MLTNTLKENISTSSKNSLKSFEDIPIFKQFQLKEVTHIDKSKPNIGRILTSMVDPEIYSIYVFDTIKGESFEGKNLTGKKLSIIFKLHEKILYATDIADQSVHAIENTFYISSKFSIPDKIEGSLPEILLKSNLLIPSISIEDLSVKALDTRNIVKHLHFSITIEVMPTYSLCFTEHSTTKTSNLFLAFKNGTRKKTLTHETTYKCLLPKWSPCGQKIAYLSNKEGANLLYLSTLSGNILPLLLPNYIAEVIDFCWGRLSNILYLSAKSFEGIEIYKFNIFTKVFTRLTFSHHKYTNTAPQYHLIENKLIFKRVFNNLTDIYSMNEDGLNLQQLTSTGNINCFHCCTTNNTLSYVTKKSMSDGYQSTIVLFDCSQNKSEPIFFSNYFTIKQIKFSPSGHYLAFILWDYDVYNLYIYDFKKGDYYNCTNFSNSNMIFDFEWDRNSTIIYLSMIKSTLCNLFSLDIKEKTLCQITNSDASKIEVSYRPKIK